MRIGRITDSKIGKNKDGDKNVRLLTVEISDPDDLQTVELINDAGEDNNPPIDSNVIILNLGDSWPVAVAVDDGVEPDAAILPGGRKWYVTAAGVVVGYIIGKASGQIDINGNLTVDP